MSLNPPRSNRMRAGLRPILAASFCLIFTVPTVAQTCSSVEFSSVKQAVGDGPGVVLSQISATEFEVFIRAVDSATCGSPGEYVSDPNKPLIGSVSFSYSRPTDGTRVLKLEAPTVESVAVAGSGNTSFSLAATNGVADQPLRFNYSDVGALTLSIQLDVPGLAGISPEIVVAPAAIVFESITGPDGVEHDASVANASSSQVFAQAGEAFSVVLSVQNSDGNSVPNFGREWGANNGEQLIVRSELLSPSPATEGGVNGHLGNGVLVNGTEFERVGNGSTFRNNAVAFGEVGIIQLKASIAPEGNEADDNSDANNAVGIGSYLGLPAASSPVASAGAVGRFIPAEFAVDVGLARFRSGCELDDDEALLVGAGGFTYRGQWLTFATDVEPTITITALSAAIDGNPVTTTNYSGDYFKVSRRTLADRTYTDSDPAVTLTASNLDIPDPMDPDETVMADVLVMPDADNRGSGTIEFFLDPVPDAAGNARLLVVDQVDAAPVTANIVLTFTLSDADGVQSEEGGLVTVGGPVPGAGILFTGDRQLNDAAGNAVDVSGNTVRAGRLNINNAFGPVDTSAGGAEPNLLTPLPLVAEYFDGTRWAINDWDYCTTIDRDAITRLDITNTFTPMTRFVPDPTAAPPIVADQAIAPLRGGDARLLAFSRVSGSAPVGYDFLVASQNIDYLNRPDNPSLSSALVTIGTYIGDPRIRQISYRNSIIFQ